MKRVSNVTSKFNFVNLLIFASMSSFGDKNLDCDYPKRRLCFEAPALRDFSRYIPIPREVSVVFFTHIPR